MAENKEELKLKYEMQNDQFDIDVKNFLNQLNELIKKDLEKQIPAIKILSNELTKVVETSLKNQLPYIDSALKKQITYFPFRVREYNDLSKYSEQVQAGLPDEIEDYLELKSESEYYTLLSDILNKHDIFSGNFRNYEYKVYLPFLYSYQENLIGKLFPSGTSVFKIKAKKGSLDIFKKNWREKLKSEYQDEYSIYLCLALSAANSTYQDYKNDGDTVKRHAVVHGKVDPENWNVNSFYEVLYAIISISIVFDL